MRPLPIKDYVPHLKKLMEAIHGLSRGGILGTSDRMTKRNDVRAEKDGYVTRDLAWLYTPSKRRGYYPN